MHNPTSLAIATDCESEFAASGGCDRTLAFSPDADEKAWTAGELAVLLHGARRARSGHKLGFLAEGLAHDLNNVLAPIVTMMEIMLRFYPPNEKVHDLLRLSQRHARQGVALIQQIHSLGSGIEHDHACIQPASLLRDLHKQVSLEMPQHVRVRLHAPAEAWPLLGSLRELHQALLAICLRARRVMPDGGVLNLEAKNLMVDDEYPFVEDGTPAARYIRITISDNGPALSEEEQELLFDRDRLEHEWDDVAGRLVTAEQTVRAHHGHITVSSGRRGRRGTTIQVYLPAAPGSASSTWRENTEPPLGKGEWILLVDDEPAFVSVTKAAFEAFGYRVLTASNGAAAVAKYLEHREKIALVFLDMTMPFMDGTATMQTLQRISADVKIIATSGLNPKRQLARTLAVGVTHFVPKPCDMAQLLQLMHGLIHAGKAA